MRRKCADGPLLAGELATGAARQVVEEWLVGQTVIIGPASRTYRSAGGPEILGAPYAAAGVKPMASPAECAQWRAELRSLNSQLTMWLARLRAATNPQERGQAQQVVEALNSEIQGLREEILAQCGPGSLPPSHKVAIVGVEATQATQYFHFNRQGSGFAADNSLPLVANKDLILRMYIGYLPPGGTLTGKLSSTGRPDRAPINGPIPGRTLDAIDRGNPDHTLNFRVPGAECIGSRAFTIQVWDPAHVGEIVYSSTTTVFQSFDVVPQPRVHGVLIHYTGNNLDITAPTGADLVNTLSFPARTYPISGFNYISCAMQDFSGDLTGAPSATSSACGPGWDALFSVLANLRAATTSTGLDVFIALLPSAVPTNATIGCGGGGLAATYQGAGTVLAQEAAHAFGRAHAPCGAPGPDPNYPTYDSYPSGSIGEFGFDTAGPQIYNPASTYDFMAYCGPNWVSPYTWLGLKNAIANAGATQAAAAPAGVLPQRTVQREYLHLNYRMTPAGAVELLPSFHLPGSAPPEQSGGKSDVVCELLGPDGELIYAHHCRTTDPHREPDDVSTAQFHETIPWWPEVRSITFRRAGEPVHTLQVEDAAPQLGEVRVVRSERADHLVRVEWAATPSQQGDAEMQPLTYLVRYSHDDGRSWRAVAAQLTREQTVVNLELLPGGDQAVFEVVASSGIRTAVATSQPLPVPVKPRQVWILAPATDADFPAGAAVELLGGGFSPDFETSDYEDVSWTSNRDGPLGVGYQLVTQDLSSGRHRITLTVPDGLGGDATATLGLTIR